jgi:hypothetical protein
MDMFHIELLSTIYVQCSVYFANSIQGLLVVELV